MKNIFVLLLFFCFNTYAQSGGAKDYYLSGSYIFGNNITWQNYASTTTQSKPISGFELNYSKPSTGKKSWQKENNFPEKGGGFTYYNLNNPKELGNIYATYIFCDIPFSKKEKTFQLYMRLSTGITYIPKHFDPISNPNDFMLSTPINAYVNVKCFYRWNFKKHFCWDFGLSYAHTSNGNSNLPNLGANMVTINTGLVYKFINPQKSTITKIDSGTYVKSKYDFVLWAGEGIVQNKIAGKRYLAQSYSPTFYYNLRTTQKIGMGIDIFYNAANIDSMKQEGIILTNNMQNIQTGIKVAYAYNLGRLSLPAEIGYYVISKYKNESPFYQRIGIRYTFKNNIIALITLKTYYFGAYNLEFGVGYRFGIK